MKKKLLIPYLLFSIPLLAIFIGFSSYQTYYHGFFQGMHLSLLVWSMYVLCIPAAHGRILFGLPVTLITKKIFFPEPYVWTLAAALNIVTMYLNPAIYLQTLPTYLLHRIFVVPEYLIILVVAALGTWYRTLCSVTRYMSNEGTHTIIRHLLFLFGIFLLFYLTCYDVVLMVNAMANG